MRNFILAVLSVVCVTLPVNVYASGFFGSSGAGGGSGVDTVGAFSASAQSNGADITGTTITFGPAQTTTPGMVGSGAQTWNGVKTFASGPVFSAAPTFSSATASKIMLTDGSKVLASSSYGEADLALTSTNQTIGGIKTFSSPIKLSALTVNRVPYIDGGGSLAESDVTPTALNYIRGLTSDAQTQISSKVGSASPTFTGNVTLPAGTSTVAGAGLGNTANGLSLYTTNTTAMLTNSTSKHLWYPTGDQEEYGTSGSNLTHTMYGSGTSGTFFGLDNSTGGLLYIKSSGSGEATTNQGIGTFYISGGTQSMKIRRDGRFLNGTGANTGRGGMIGVEAPADNTITGTTTANATTTITGSSTVFLYQVSVGDQIALSSASTTFATVTAVASNTSLTVDTALGDGTSQTIIVRRTLISGYDINNSDALTYKLLSNGQSAQNFPDNSVGLALTSADASVDSSDVFVRFLESDGQTAGEISGNGDNTVQYLTFTGSHWTKFRRSNPLYGDLLCATNEKPFKDKPKLFGTEVCNKRRDPSVIGVYSGTDKEGRASVMAIGTGRMRVINTGKDIAMGDYLMSSDTPGAAEIQNDDLYHNYTAAKATEEIQWKRGETERTISVIYEGG